MIVISLLFGCFEVFLEVILVSSGQADTSPTEVLCKVLLTVAACRKENGLVVCGIEALVIA
jgi:hypothetical protein